MLFFSLPSQVILKKKSFVTLMDFFGMSEIKQLFKKKKHLLPFFVINFRRQNSYRYYLAPALNLFRTSFISSMSRLPCLFFYLAVWGLCCNVWDLQLWHVGSSSLTRGRTWVSCIGSTVLTIGPLGKCLLLALLINKGNIAKLF